MRTQLLAAITTATSTLTQFAVSQELPFEQSGTALFLKNKKRIYVDEERREQTTLIALLNATDIYQDDLITNVYLSVDAKNTPSQLDSVVSKILSAKANTGIVNFGVESDYSVDKQEDVLIYNFEFRMNTIT
jgi:hypothetical protein